MCVFFPFILDIKFVERTSRSHTGERSHRISHSVLIQYNKSVQPTVYSNLVLCPPNACLILVSYIAEWASIGMVANPLRGLIIWSRETGSAVPSCASSLLLRTQAISSMHVWCLLTGYSIFSRFPRRRPAIPSTVIIDRASPKRIGSRPCVSMASAATSPPAQGQLSSRYSTLARVMCAFYTHTLTFNNKQYNKPYGPISIIQ